MAQCETCKSDVESVVRGVGWYSYNCQTCMHNYCYEIIKNEKPWRSALKSKTPINNNAKHVHITNAAEITQSAISKESVTNSNVEVTNRVKPPQTLRTLLISALNNDGYPEISAAVSNGTSDNLSQEQKNLLMEYASKVRTEFERSRPDIRNSLVEVSTSGWGNEPETTTPGAIQPIMAL